MPASGTLENERLLELFFAQSTDGFFFMMLDQPVEWGEHVDKEEVLDYVFEHQRMTKVNSAIVTQFNAPRPESCRDERRRSSSRTTFRVLGAMARVLRSLGTCTRRPTSGGSTARHAHRG